MVEDYQENYGTGWISLYRSIKNHWVFDNDKYFKWWVIMLFEVNHLEKKITRYYEVYSIKKGQSCNSLRTWAELFKTTPKTVSKFFDLLEKDEMITRSNIGKGKQALTLINITNYSDYQSKSKQGLPQGVNKEETRSKQGLPTNNNYNNDNKREYNEKIFISDWNKIRTELLKKPSHLNRLNFELKNIVTTLDRENTQKALRGFFKQEYFPRGQDYTVNPKHFLNHFEIYLQAYHDKNPKVWGKE